MSDYSELAKELMKPDPRRSAIEMMRKHHTHTEAYVAANKCAQAQRDNGHEDRFQFWNKVALIIFEDGQKEKSELIPESEIDKRQMYEDVLAAFQRRWDTVESMELYLRLETKFLRLIGVKPPNPIEEKTDEA